MAGRAVHALQNRRSMTQPARERRAGEPARLLLVCDDRERGEALLEAIGQPEAPLFEAKAIGGWEMVPAGAVVLFERSPDLSRTRRRLRFARSRVIVVAWPDQPRLIELVLREKGTVVTWPGSVERLAAELSRCLDAREGSVVLQPERIADELCQELSRRLRRNAPQLRLADATRIEALVDKLTCAVLEEARELEGAPVADLDWEHVSTAVQTREESAIFRRRAADGAPDRDPDGEDTNPGLRALRPPPPNPPDPVSLMETRPYAPVTTEQLDLLSHVEWIDDEDAGEAAAEDAEEAREPSRPPPLPARPSVPAVALGRRPRPVRAWVGIGLVLATATAGIVLAAIPEPAPTPPLAATPPPRATLELGQPTVTPVLEELIEPSEVEPSEVVAEAPEPTRAAPALSAREERARRSSIRARAHHRMGRHERALAAARYAVRLAPEVESYAALVAELEAEVPSTPAVTTEPGSATLPE